MLVRWAGVFFAVAASDVCWARCVNATANHARWEAASWATILQLLIAWAIIEYARDQRLVVAAAMGAFFGTALGVR
jgi:hypothetical protein